MVVSIIPLILLTVVLNTAAQLILKMGMEKIGVFSFAIENIVPVGLKLILSPFIMVGVLIYVFSLMMWLLVLSRAPVNIAYPMTSLAYIFNAIGAYYLFGEHLSYFQILGICLIILGVYFLAQH
jgi:drug/metabolite transporter (DMT)-like permease